LRDRGTLAATADALHITPSAVSQQIRALSEEIGVPLLSQHGRGVRLTPQAHVLIRYTMAIDLQLELAQTELTAITEGWLGRVAVGAPASTMPDLVVPAVLRLRQTRPNLDVSIREVDTHSDIPNYLTLLDQNELDAVIAVDFSDGPRWDKDRYRRIDLLLDPLLVALPEAHPLASQQAIDLENLASETWVMGPDLIPSKELAIAACTSAGFKPNIGHYVDNWNAVLAIVANIGSVALVPRMGTTTWSRPGVALRSLNGYDGLGRRFYVALRSGSEANPSLTPLLDAMKETAEGLIASHGGSYYKHF
jgi:DNA-binding transcriptional LysR family regulator